MIAAGLFLLMATLSALHGILAAFSASASDDGLIGWPVILGGVMIVGMPVFVLAMITMAVLVAFIRLPRFMRIAGRILRAMGLLLFLAGMEWYLGILDDLLFPAIGIAGGICGWFGGGFIIRQANASDV